MENNDWRPATDSQPHAGNQEDRSSAVVGRRSSVVGVLVLLAFAILLPSLGSAQEQEQNRAALVVRHGDGRVVTACVPFSEPSISGIELLRRSGLSFIVQGGGVGQAVCKLDGEGCDYPTEDCFCKRDGPTTTYWAYNRLKDGQWLFSPLGASNTQVQPGDVEGWAWGTGSVQSGAQPPILTFEQVCAPNTNPSAVEQPPAPTPEPPTVEPPTAAPPTPEPTVQLQPSPTARPAATSQGAAATQQPTAPPATVEASAPTSAPTLIPTIAEPTAPAEATLAPTSTHTTLPERTQEPTAQPTLVIPTPSSTPPSGTTSPLGYIVFGVAALGLIGAITATAIRRR